MQNRIGCHAERMWASPLQGVAQACSVRQQRAIFLGDQLGGLFTAHVGFVALGLKF